MPRSAPGLVPGLSERVGGLSGTAVRRYGGRNLGLDQPKAANCLDSQPPAELSLVPLYFLYLFSFKKKKKGLRKGLEPPRPVLAKLTLVPLLYRSCTALVPLLYRSRTALGSGSEYLGGHLDSSQGSPNASAA